MSFKMAEKGLVAGKRSFVNIWYSGSFERKNNGSGGEDIQ
jgi:hypothetical protein